MLALLGIVSLTVGGIGIMNIMLVSVAERRREIALRMAVGATRGDIANQFLCEAVCLSLGGGLLGIVVGIAGVFIINASGWNAAVSAWIPALAIVVSVATGATFGAYPAWQAGRFFPMDSLRGL